MPKKYKQSDIINKMQPCKWDYVGKLGFCWNGTLITNPYSDETGRLKVDPIKYYGLTKKDVERMRKNSI
jgi:hypothetical protein